MSTEQEPHHLDSMLEEICLTAQSLDQQIGLLTRQLTGLENPVVSPETKDAIEKASITLHKIACTLKS